MENILIFPRSQMVFPDFPLLALTQRKAVCLVNDGNTKGSVFFAFLNTWTHKLGTGKPKVSICWRKIKIYYKRKSLITLRVKEESRNSRPIDTLLIFPCKSPVTCDWPLGIQDRGQNWNEQLMQCGKASGSCWKGRQPWTFCFSDSFLS